MKEFEQFGYCCPECFMNFVLPSESEEETCLDCGCIMYCIPMDLLDHFDDWRD
jgi:hypothetical protein